MQGHPQTVQQPAKPLRVRGSDALQQKAMRPGDGSQASAVAVSRAEEALEQLSVNFDEWMACEVARLHEARNHAMEAGLSPESLDRLFSVAHDLKGQASTLGYPLAAAICASLSWLLETGLARGRVPARLVDQHVDAVRAILREGARGDDHPKASVLSSKLREVTSDYLARVTG